jgi:hypothetical protein
MLAHETKPKDKNPKKMGRKELPIDPQEVMKLAIMQCSNTEIAAFFDCDEGTIRRRFSEQVAKGREMGKMSIRRKQYENAVTHNNTVMQIWLGKNYLNQTDKRAIETSLEVNNLADIAAIMAGQRE